MLKKLVGGAGRRRPRPPRGGTQGHSPAWGLVGRPEKNALDSWVSDAFCRFIAGLAGKSKSYFGLEGHAEGVLGRASPYRLISCLAERSNTVFLEIMCFINMCLPVTAIVMILLNSYCSKEISRAKSLKLISTRNRNRKLHKELNGSRTSIIWTPARSQACQ